MIRGALVAVIVLVVFIVRPPLVHGAVLYQLDDQADASTILQSWVRAQHAPATLSVTERSTLQPDYPYHALFTPNDPQFSLQWNFQAMNAPAAWDFDQTDPTHGGDPGVVVAILDTGLAYESFQSFIVGPEVVTNRIWTNPDEVTDGIDNDGNGLVDDVHGWDFSNNDAHPNDDHGHGTHIAGTIAGQTDNFIAVAGLAWQSTIMPLKVLNGSGDGSTSTIVTAINYALQAGADIINLSLGGSNDDPLLHQAIQAAVSRGVVVIAASGNDNAASLNYPARYSETIAVGAVQQDLQRAPYSNYGANLDLMAPGGNVNLDQDNNGVADGVGIPQQTCTSTACSSFATYYYTGTSQAAAHVAGAAALLLACGVPGGAVQSVLMTAATDLGVSGVDSEYGAGLVNIQAAMSQGGCGLPIPVMAGAITAVSSSTTTRQIRSRVPAPYTKPIFSWSGASGAVYQVQWGKQGSSASTTTQTSGSFTPILTSQGLYQLTVRVIDALDRVSDAQTFLYRFRRPTFAHGTSGNPSTITLTESTGRVVRTFSARLGSVSPALSGTLTSRQSLRLVVGGQGSGTGVSVINTLGPRLSSWRPFGTALTGGISAVGVRRLNQETLIAVTGANQGSTIRWMTLAGQRVRSLKAFANHNAGLTITSADLDGDGNDEVIVAKNGGSWLAAYSLSGQRLWQSQALGKSWRGRWSLTALDRDNDGRDEVAVAGLRSIGASTVILMSATGRSLITWTLRPSNGVGQVDLAAADLNGNGTEELLSLRQQGTGLVDVWSPTGRRASTVTLRRSTSTNSFAILD